MGAGARPPDTGWSWSRRQLAVAGTIVIAIAAAVVVLVQRSEREPAPAAGASPSATESAPASNLDNDMHDGSVTRGDAWLAANLPAVLASRWFADDGTVIVTMDENDASPSGSCCAGAHGGRVPMVVISVRARARGAIVTPGDHYGTLRSIEEVSGLPFLGNAARAQNGDLSSLFG